MRTKIKTSQVDSLLSTLIGKSCWHVSAGGSGGNTFGLDFGSKIKRLHPLRKSLNSTEFRWFEGEYKLIAWCAWRLDGEGSPLACSDQSPSSIRKALQSLVGKRVRAIITRPPAWDLQIAFTGRLSLQLFCNNIPAQFDFEGNWDCWIKDIGLIVGPGNRIRLEKR